MKYEMKERFSEPEYYIVNLCEKDGVSYTQTALRPKYEFLKSEFVSLYKNLQELKLEGIQPIVEIFVEEDSQSFVCQEYYDLPTLKIRLAKREFSVDEVADFLREATITLKKLCDAGIYHLDLDPENIMYDGYTLYFTSFLGKEFLLNALENETKNKSSLDASSILQLQKEKSYLYSAYEVIEGLDTIDERSDIYSLGAVLFKCLTGKVYNPSGPMESEEKLGKLKNLIDSMLSKDIKARPRYEDILKGLNEIAPETEKRKDVPSAAWSLIGMKLNNGQYEITDFLAKGGMAWVFNGTQTGIGIKKRPVVIKVLPIVQQEPEMVERFINEANAQWELEHANIVRIYHAGFEQDLPYIVMEKMSQTLRDRIKSDEGSDPDDVSTETRKEKAIESLKIVVNILKGLDYAHKKGLVHRDIKPANIFFDDSDAVKIGDFGLVKVADASRILTRTGYYCGTLHYSSPEQCDPDFLEGQQLDGRSDIYSVGIVLFELLAGELPYAGSSDRHVMGGHLMKPLPVEKIIDVPQQVIAILEKACVKKPSCRYQTAGEMIEDIELYLKGDVPKAFAAYTEKGNEQKKLEAEKLYSKALISLDKKEVDEAERLLAMVLELDPEHERARERLEKLVSLQGTGMEQQEKVSAGERSSEEQGGFSSKLMVFMFLILLLLTGGYYFKDQIFPKKEIQNVGAKEAKRLADLATKKAEKKHLAAIEVEKSKVPSNMVLVKGGTFQMGSPESEKDRSSNEGPVHTVTVDSFYIGKYEVTQNEWKAVMGDNPSRFKGDNLPVESVSWFDAVEFCNKKSKQEGKTVCYTINGENVTCDWGAKGYRLPTEAEWEYACRAGTTTPFHYGNSLDSTMANFNGNYPYGGASKGVYRGKTTQVGSFRPNAFGLYDMHGNVYEWCWDWYDSKYYENSTRTNPRGPGKNSFRVLRGGGWYYFGWDCRCAFRSRVGPSLRSGNLGFRLVRFVGH